MTNTAESKNLNVIIPRLHLAISAVAVLIICISLILVLHRYTLHPIQEKMLVASEINATNRSTEVTTTISRFSHVSAQCLVSLPEHQSVDRSAGARLLFQHQNSTPDPLIEHSRGVEVLSDGIKILHTGLYNIYSNLHFKAGNIIPCTELTNKETIIFLQKQYGVDRKHQTYVASSRLMCCETCVLSQETSYTATTTILQTSDVIRVVVSGYGMNHLQSESSFVGLFMLAAV
ncbi:uncharacterized protein LOC131936090 [Physella acuta]|uniref:uncharacterized protein LOC131936090 n=1 Tax=Physella acuta TaxID=109671 RepID=UPI0027DD0C1F|nr:uncharacterized protein LOC131936090 [Physella acuta]